jgi:hypothetical protein
MAAANIGPSVATTSAEYFSDDSDDGYDYEPETTLDSIGNSKTINFSIRASYTNWKPREAFRELVQNWYGSPLRSPTPDAYLSGLINLMSTYLGGTASSNLSISPRTISASFVKRKPLAAILRLPTKCRTSTPPTTGKNGSATFASRAATARVH